MSAERPSAPARWRTGLKDGFAWLDDGLAWSERGVLVISIMAMAAISVANVIARNTLGMSIPFAHDVSQILVVIVTFMGIGIGAREARHIRVSAIHDLLPEKVRKVLLVIVTLTTSLVLLALANYGWDYARSTQRSCRVLPEHIDLFGWALPVGALPLAAGLLLTLAGLILAGHGVRLIHRYGSRLLERLGPVTQPLVLGLALVAGFLVLAALFVGFMELVANREGRCRVTSATNFPVYLVHMLVPLGFLLGGIQFGLAGLRNLISPGNYLSWYRPDEYESSDRAGLSDAQSSAAEDADQGERANG